MTSSRTAASAATTELSNGCAFMLVAGLRLAGAGGWASFRQEVSCSDRRNWFAETKWRSLPRAASPLKSTAVHGAAGWQAERVSDLSSALPLARVLRLETSRAPLTQTRDRLEACRRRSYQMEFATNLTQPNWSNYGIPITAANTPAIASDT